MLPQLEDTARKRGCSLEDHLIALGQFLPAFSARVLDSIEA